MWWRFIYCDMCVCVCTHTHTHTHVCARTHTHTRHHINIGLGIAVYIMNMSTWWVFPSFCIVISKMVGAKYQSEQWYHYYQTELLCLFYIVGNHVSKCQTYYAMLSVWNKSKSVLRTCNLLHALVDSVFAWNMVLIQVQNCIFSYTNSQGYILRTDSGLHFQ
jgi:hypothetical protein